MTNQSNLFKIHKIRQKLVNRPIEDINNEVLIQLKNLYLSSRIRPGQTVAITGGSRGIRNIQVITKTVVDYLKSLGLQPFIFPAMGSHGGANEVGQVEVLAHYGITSETMGVPIKASMNVRVIGTTSEGITVFADSYACEADHIFVINRIKPHSKFKGQLESGLCKMLTIGLGKHRGAEYYHQQALKYGFPTVIQSVAETVLQKMSVLGGLAIIEDGYDQTSIIKGVLPQAFIETEKELLEVAKSYLPRLPFQDLDILIVDEIGKDISGSGMDYNVIGRNRDIMNCWYSPQKIKRIFVRNLTPNTKGNGLGIGLADYTTDRLVNSLDLQTMYVNALTASGPESAAIPIHFANDRLAVQACLATIGPITPSQARAVWIKNTLQLEHVWVSEGLYEEVSKRSDLELEGDWEEMVFDSQDNLISPFERDCVS